MRIIIGPYNQRKTVSCGERGTRVLRTSFYQISEQRKARRINLGQLGRTLQKLELEIIITSRLLSEVYICTTLVIIFLICQRGV